MKLSKCILAADDPDIDRFLRDCAGVRVAARVADGEEAVARARAIRPDIAILDMAMPRLDYSSVIRRIRVAVPGCGVLVVVARHEEDHVVPIVSAGASGYLRKERIRDELGPAIDALSKGGVYYDPDVVRILAVKLADGECSGSAAP